MAPNEFAIEILKVLKLHFDKNKTYSGEEIINKFNLLIKRLQ